jgi:hypothetical protein
MMKTTTAVGAIWLAIAAVGLADDNADEIKRLQGRFERTYANAAGTMFRVVKDVSGDQSIVTTYDDVGNVIEAHTSTFKIEKRGSVRVFSFFNMTVTAGPQKGVVDFATRSYIYRIDGDMIGEAWGLLEGDDSPPRMIYWRRVKAE